MKHQIMKVPWEKISVTLAPKKQNIKENTILDPAQMNGSSYGLLNPNLPEKIPCRNKKIKNNIQ